MNFSTILLSILRAVKFSLQDVVRNFWLSIVTVIILVLALFSVNTLLTMRVITASAIDSIKEKVDINLYLKNESTETEIMALKAEVSNLSQVKSVAYVSKQQALDAFKDKHKNDPDVLEALRQLNKNPLTPTLVIKPQKVDNYDDLINNINRIQSNIIESRNFDNPKSMLEKINGIAIKVNEAGMFVTLIFILITILVVYNSIRVAIYTHQREIKIMRLVGASNWFIRAPYIFSSLIYTLVGLILTIAVFYPFLSILQPYLETFFSGYSFNIISYFQTNFWRFFMLEFFAAGAINVFASWVAVRKYSKV